MTIIELNIAGLHVTGSSATFKLSLQRNCRALKRKSKQWRPRHVLQRSAA
jgi:hypothetical protein